jgi:hypothetical protein
MEASVGSRGVLGGLAVLLVAAVAGCGGDDGPTTEERRAAMAKWQQQADAACARAERAIVALGEPIDAKDVDRIVVRATPHLRRAAESIRKLRTPPGEAAKVEPVLEALDRLERPLDDVGKWSEVGKREEVVKAATRWRAEGAALERAADAAGLRVCGRDGQRDATADAILAPIYATQLNELGNNLAVRIQTVRENYRITDERSLTEHLEQYAAVVDHGTTVLTVMEPPVRAADEAEAYYHALYDTAENARRAADKARRQGYTTALLRALDKGYEQRFRRERKAYDALVRALRRIPGGDVDKRKPREPVA